MCFLQELEQWDKWEENPVVVIPDKPVNPVQAKIEQYRQQVVKPPESPTEEQYFFEVILNEILLSQLSMNFIYLKSFVQDMTPKITRQTKILIKDKLMDNSSSNAAKFSAMDPIPTVSVYFNK